MDNQLTSMGQFREAYRRQLSRLLKAGENDPDSGLAAFILATANAYFDGEILTAMQDELALTFRRLRLAYADMLARGQIINERYAEDLLVFLKMGLVGLDQLNVTQHRQVAWWRVEFNQIRSFRPQRSAARPVPSIQSPFTPYNFHYDQGLCNRESFWSGDLEGKQAYLLYNKYPFARFHTLLIPEPENHLPQFLELEQHSWAWQAVQALSQSLPGFGLGYNSLGTFASVNHLHFQSFIEPTGMPVTWDIWKHNGGSETYPTACIAFDSLTDSWAYIQDIHLADTHSYNLLYTPEKIYCFERRRQGTYRHAEWTSGFAWFEVSGNLILFSQSDYLAITFEKIEKEFAKLSTQEPT